MAAPILDKHLVAQPIRSLVETRDLTPAPAGMLVGFSHEEVGQAVAEFPYQRGRRRVAAVRRLGRARAAPQPDIDALFCSSDMVALGVLTEARIHGIDVPGQLAVVGLGDHAFAAELYPALTTVRIGGGAVGRRVREARRRGKSFSSHRRRP